MHVVDSTNDSEKTATAFNVSQTSFSLLIYNQNPIEAVSFRRIATVEQLVTAGTDPWHRHTCTQSALPYPSCGYASRHDYYTWMML